MAKWPTEQQIQSTKVKRQTKQKNPPGPPLLAGSFLSRLSALYLYIYTLIHTKLQIYSAIISQFFFFQVFTSHIQFD
ncbi:hypothetical protein LguiA_032727 [Lonicera macranthoides]